MNHISGGIHCNQPMWYIKLYAICQIDHQIFCHVNLVFLTTLIERERAVATIREDTDG